MLSCLCVITQAQSSDKNYIKVYIPNTKITSESALKTSSKEACQKSVEYFDGFGRPSQKNMIQITTSGKDLIIPIVYDQYGRQAFDYLPFSAFKNGAYHDTATGSGNWSSLYGSESSYAFSKKEFEASPLNKVVEQGAPGAIWQPGENHSQRIDYTFNLADDVVYFTVEDDELKSNGTYSDHELHKTIIKDEHWVSGNLNTSEEFKNKVGQVILKRSYVKEGANISKVDTYYAYDHFGLLRFVVPPMAVNTYHSGNSGLTYQPPTVVVDNDMVLNSSEPDVIEYIINKGNSLTLKPGYSFKATTTSSLLITTLEMGPNQFNDLCYSYKYDGRKRMVEKRLPGAYPIYMVYDSRDRLVASQDGNQRKNGRWLVTKYDNSDRAVIIAFYTSSNNQVQMRNAVSTFWDAGGPKYESRGNALMSYNNESFPTTLTEADVLTANYYDDYEIANCPQDIYDNTEVTDYDHEMLLSTPVGQLTASWVKVLNGDAGRSTGLWSVNFYDDNYRIVQSYADNYLGGYDRTTQEYDFVGKVDRSIHEHKLSGRTIWEEKTFKYDHAGRLTKVEQEYSGDLVKAKATIAEMVYDELGQLKTKKLTAAGRDLDYAYNVRGWLTEMNAHKQTVVKGKTTDEFGFALNYQTGASQFGGIEQFNGNIGAMEWWSNGITALNNHQQAYGYTYDALNRVTNADFRENISGWDDTELTYDVSGISYDLNGNILKLNRFGAGTEIDHLTYGYNGNQLSYVNDGKLEIVGFKELSNTTSEYAYDANGNMLSDDNKGISEINYNLLNLPENISKGGKQIAYAYDATGVKQENRVSSSNKLQYLGNFVYKNGSLKYILNTEGKLEVNATETTGTYKFFVKDHLGNTRLAVGEGVTSVATELNHYYPFGMRMGMANSKSDPDQKYLYNGKEQQEETDWLDYGARMYDPAIGRWHCVDPLAESYYSQSIYHFSGNNPIRFIDPDGRSYTDFYDKDNKLIQHIEDGSNAKFKLTGTTKANEYFKFDGYDESQGGKNKVNFGSAVEGAQKYVLENYTSVERKNGTWETYCNYGTRNIVKTAESAANKMNLELPGAELIEGRARDMNNNLISSTLSSSTMSDAKKAATEGALSIGVSSSHVITLRNDGKVNNVGATRATNSVYYPRFSNIKTYFILKPGMYTGGSLNGVDVRAGRVFPIPRSIISPVTIK